MNTHYPEEAFEKLFQLENKNFWFKIRNHLICWAIKKYCSNAKNFLEIGCGTGFVSNGIQNQFPHIKLSASENLPQGLEYAAKRLPHASIFQMDARCIHFKNEFNAIGIFDVLEHIEEDQLVLSQIHQALTFEGIVLITVPQHPFLWSKADEYACHVRRYTRKELKIKLANAGFTVLRMTSFTSILFPFMCLSRIKKQYKLESELNIHPVINTIFTAVQSIEKIFIQLGLSFPFGGSLLAIAKKR